MNANKFSFSYRCTFMTVSLVFAGFLTACTDNPGNSDQGNEFVESQTAVSLIDTFSVELSTVVFDTVVTSGTETMLVGNYRDHVFGTITSASYFQLGVPESYDVHIDDLYDSLHLTLQYNQYSFGDTTKSQKLLVYRLTENIEFEYDDVITNKASFHYDPIPIGSVVYTPEPGNSTDTLFIKLDDAVGLDFFSKLAEDSEVMDDHQSFRDYFHGLVLKTDNNDGGCIVGFTANKEDVSLVLFTRKATTLEQNNIWFRLEDTKKQFNNIVHDFASTQLEPLVEQQQKLVNGATGGLSFLQGGSGLAIRVDFPTLQEALLFKRTSILAAQLSVFVEKNSYDSFNLPPDLTLYGSDGLNRPMSSVAQSSLVVDELYKQETTYSFDVTQYLIDELSDSYVNPEHGLLITLSSNDQNTTFYRLIADAAGKRPKLKIFYLSY